MGKTIKLTEEQIRRFFGEGFGKRLLGERIQVKEPTPSFSGDADIPKRYQKTLGHSFDSGEVDDKGKTKVVKPSSFDEINYLLYSNKDGKLDFRPLTLINPYYYYLLVRLLTTPEAWKELTDRFAALRDPHISVESVIVADDEYKEKCT